MGRRALKTLWWLIVAADIIGIVLVINPQLVPIAAAALTTYGVHWLTEPLIPEPAYDYPRWAYRLVLAIRTRATRCVARRSEPPATQSQAQQLSLHPGTAIG